MSFIVKQDLINFYQPMINDRWRNEFYYRALSKVANDKVVLDIGTGTGILAVYALNAGAKFVYAVEENKQAADMAQFILSKCFDQSRFKVIHCNFWTDDIDNQIDPNSVDVLVSETLGPGLFDQGMIQTWHCARPFLKKDAVSIPDSLSFDVRIWQHDNIDVLFQNNSNAKFIDEENLLASNYAEALKNFNDSKKATGEYTTQWRIVNNTTVAPQHEYKDFYTVTKDSLPELVFADLRPPMHIQANLKFELDLTEVNNIVALIHKASFGSDTIHLYDAKTMPWRCSPVFQIKNPGKKQFKFNPSLEHMTDTVWIVSDL
jgi:predicted RNA methylase